MLVASYDALEGLEELGTDVMQRAADAQRRESEYGQAGLKVDAGATLRAITILKNRNNSKSCERAVVERKEQSN